ncbi:MAG: pilus assembly protein PilM [Verrucomicrobiales bacterium]|nr:pilus assembly protein PilM [Verrucomicrobiales bacterium]
MLKAKPFLTIDFGAGTLKVAEFEINDAGNLVLRQFGAKSLGLEGSQETARERVVTKALQDLFTERGFSARTANVCAPGFHVFSKFIKLPPVDSAKISQIVQYEAQQNVPFPLAEVVWDYQILGTAPGGEMEVLLVAIKTDIVEGLFRVAETRGVRLQGVDVSPAALANAFRFNYSDEDGCTMLLDIGAKTSTVLFFEKGKIYARSISIGANSITQDFATESKIRFNEAEQFKVQHGQVSLGGAYEEPEDPKQAAIGKVARQVMTRLHIQVNQTIQFYRGQQGGGAPQRLVLSGGASIMPYTAQFFAEKLNVPVEYFNPLRNVTVGPSVNVDELQGMAHSMGELVGTALRNLAQCPIELNLLPKSSIKRQQFEAKKPYFLASLFSLVVVVFGLGYFTRQVANDKTTALETITSKVEPLAAKEQQLTSAASTLKSVETDAGQYKEWLAAKYRWVDIFGELRKSLLAAEDKAKTADVDIGIWIESLHMGDVVKEMGETEEAPAAEEKPTTYQMSPELMRRYGLLPAATATTEGDGGDASGGGGESSASSSAATKKKKGSTNEVSEISLTLRAVNLYSLDVTKNLHIAAAVEQELKANPMFDPASTRLGKQSTPDENAPTFTFELTLGLKDPIKL